MKRRKVKTSERQDGTKRMPPWLRRVGVVTVCLLVGAVISAGVALAFTGENSRRTMAHSSFSPPPEMHARWWRAHAPAGFSPSPSLDGFLARRTGATMLFMQDGPARTVLADYQVIVIRQGWPWRCLEGATWSDNTPWLASRAKPVVLRKNVYSVATSRDVPLKPIWTGLLLNALFFGAILWVVFTLPKEVRAMRGTVRRKQGLCPDCGYDLRGADHGKCPECGEAV